MLFGREKLGVLRIKFVFRRWGRGGGVEDEIFFRREVVGGGGALRMKCFSGDISWGC